MGSFFRFPGSKTKLVTKIANKIGNVGNFEYREPFFGSGSVGLSLNTHKIWLNDLDLGISCLWTSLINRPDLLKAKILNFKPSVDAFFEFKTELLSKPPELVTDNQIVDYGFKKLAIHQLSYSGLGVKSGGPLGGIKQESAYGIGCRWSPTYLRKKIDLLHKKLANCQVRYKKCTNFDFMSLIIDETPCFLYLDPPYYDKGADLYQHSFTEADHARLATALKQTSHKWLLSYDDCPQIRNLYSWAIIEKVSVNYTIKNSRTKTELLIYVVP